MWSNPSHVSISENYSKVQVREQLAANSVSRCPLFCFCIFNIYPVLLPGVKNGPNCRKSSSSLSIFPVGLWVSHAFWGRRRKRFKAFSQAAQCSYLQQSSLCLYCKFRMIYDASCREIGILDSDIFCSLLNPHQNFTHTRFTKRYSVDGIMSYFNSLHALKWVDASVVLSGIMTYLLLQDHRHLPVECSSTSYWLSLRTPFDIGEQSRYKCLKWRGYILLLSF